MKKEWEVERYQRLKEVTEEDMKSKGKSSSDDNLTFGILTPKLKKWFQQIPGTTLETFSEQHRRLLARRAYC